MSLLRCRGRNRVRERVCHRGDLPNRQQLQIRRPSHVIVYQNCRLYPAHDLSDNERLSL